MKLALITARGGSKRIPRKNIRPFRGRPMLAWPLQAALESKLFDTVMVSTDDEEIARIAVENGAEVPFLRSSATANDYATTADVIVEVLNEYKTRGSVFEFACCIYPTAPFLSAQDLRDGYTRLADGGYDAVMPVTEFSYSIWRSLARAANGRIRLNFPEHLNSRSQDLTPAYHDAGQWYWFRVPAFETSRALLGPNTGSVLLPPSRVQDIDTEDDWIIAELKHKALFG